MEEKLKYLIRIGKILLLIIGGLIALSVWIAYEMSVIFGVPSFKPYPSNEMVRWNYEIYST